MSAPITRIALYVKDMPRIAAFYEKHFAFRPTVVADDKMVLTPATEGCALVLMPASRGHRVGQSCVKIVFDVADVPAFKEASAQAGLKFGPVHRGPGYEFANARDPAKNLIQISNSHLAALPEGEPISPHFHNPLIDAMPRTNYPRSPCSRFDVCWRP